MTTANFSADPELVFSLTDIQENKCLLQVHMVKQAFSKIVLIFPVGQIEKVAVSAVCWGYFILAKTKSFVMRMC